MNITYASEFDATGSGYTSISVTICNALVEMGHKVTALGIGYKGEEHHWPFTLIPVERSGFFKFLTVMIHNLQLDPDYAGKVLVGLDIPMQLTLMEMTKKETAPFIGFFPLEAPSLNFTWASLLAQQKAHLVMSEYGTEELKRYGLNAVFIPVPVDMNSWRIPASEERTRIRETMGIASDQKVVLSVADNQERKNLGATLEIIRNVPNTTLWLVTRRDTGVGWNLDDLIGEYGISDRVLIFERGLPFKNLWMLYAGADAYLATSKAEGLGMPILEAMSCGVPCVAPRHTSFYEHLSGGRGYLFDCAHQYRDPFGNEWRYFADVKEGALALESALRNDNSQIIADALGYIKSRSIEAMKGALNEALS